MKYLLDTHVVDWIQNDVDRLSPKIHSILSEVGPGESAITDVTLTELARHLIAKRIKTPLPPSRWLQFAIVGIRVLPVTPAIALFAAKLDWKHRDPCDRHIVATAVVHKLPLLSIDEKIHDLVGVRGLKVIW